MPEFDLFVLGTGPAASRVALRCADFGWKVGIVDNRPYGGTCALRGCNPKKVLVRAAELMDWIARAEGRGVRTQDARIDWAELMRFKRTFTGPVTETKNDMFEEAGIARYEGPTRFLGPNTLEVAGEEVAAKKIVVATGATPRPLDLPGSEWIASSDVFLDLDELPRRIVFLGGGYISFEFAHVAARAGATVTVVEMRDRVLTGFDADLVDTLVDRTRQLGIDVRTSTKPVGIERRDDASLSVEIKTEKGSETLEVDLVVHGAGRVPNVEGLDLEKGEVRHGADGIAVNEFLQSVSNEDVYAAGDVAATSVAMLSPTAALEGRIVAKNLLEGNFHQPDYGAVASAVFSVPSLASVGMLEEEATRQSLHFTVRSGDRALDNSMQKVGAAHARYKLLLENSSGRILGAHLLGPDAAETINLFALAMNYGLTASQIKATLLVFPTFGHDVREMV